jgi:hypothetical protein
MKRGTSQGRVEKQSNPACGLRALTPNRQSVRFSSQPGTTPQQIVPRILKYYIVDNERLGRLEEITLE